LLFWNGFQPALEQRIEACPVPGGPGNRGTTAARIVSRLWGDFRWD